MADGARVLDAVFFCVVGVAEVILGEGKVWSELFCEEMWSEKKSASDARTQARLPVLPKTRARREVGGVECARMDGGGGRIC